MFQKSRVISYRKVTSKTVTYKPKFAYSQNYLFAETWVDLETVIQNEVSQKQKQISYIKAHIYMGSRKMV